MTDLNYLLARHQLSIFASHNAANIDARAAHKAFASAYAERIRVLQIALGSTSPIFAGG